MAIRTQAHESAVAASARPRSSVVHATFCVERTYGASPAQVFHALTDPIAKARWFSGGEGYTLLEH